MLAMIEAIVRDVENDGVILTRDACCRALAERMGLDDFGEVMLSMPDSRFQKVSSLLPAMSSAAVQDQWTGNNGYPLLRQTANVVRSFSYNVSRLSGRDLQGIKILDYGCGYGRIARLIWFFTAPENLYGVDPWFRSIEECERTGMGANFRVSDYMPNELPVDGNMFDCAYAFSVFTHLSRDAALTALAAVRRQVVTGGIFMITVRPVEYWTVAERIYDYATADYIAQHERDGFAFHPQPGNAGSSGTPTYGDTSMSLDWIRTNVPGWKIECMDRSIEDAYQVYVFLRAV